jgi:hypothetical protein
MPVKQTIPYTYGIYSITFTCYNWLPVIDKVNGYDIIYHWFDYLRNQRHFITGYVIMPNHVPIMIGFKNTMQDINTIIGNGKRFMAYEITKRLQQIGEQLLLYKLNQLVEKTRKANHKKHEVWELSFDWKQCETLDFILQKLDYYHRNPCKGKWNLCINPFDYLHSSAWYYITGEQGAYAVTNCVDLLEIDLSK